MIDSKKIKYIFPISRSPKGYVSVLYTNDNKKYIAKTGVCLQQEMKAYRFLTKVGFPYIPKFYGRISKGGVRYMILEFIEGEKLSSANIDKFLPLIAKSVARLHLIQKNVLKYVSYFLDKEKREIDRCANISESLCKKNNNFKLLNYIQKMKEYLILLEKIFERSNFILKEKIAPSFINKELSNFIITRNKVYILDWEFSEFGDPAYDLAYLKNSFTNFDLEKFLKKYCKIYSKFSRNIFLRIFFYQYIQLLRKIFNTFEDYFINNAYLKFPFSELKDYYFSIYLHRLFTKIDKLKEKILNFLRMR